ncbi:MAG: hypothetical protein ACFFCZ_19630 [Promethearchaeota archaeon]
MKLGRRANPPYFAGMIQGHVPHPDYKGENTNLAKALSAERILEFIKESFE